MGEEVLLIFGINKFAELMKYYIENTTDYVVSAYTVNREYVEKKSIEGTDVIPFEEIDKIYGNKQVKILVAVGYNNMNNVRKKVFDNIIKKGYIIISYIHPSSNIAENIEMSTGNIILEDVLIQPYVKIGQGNIIWSNVNISHHAVIGDYNYFSPMVSLSGNTVIKNNCFFGNNCVIKNGISISDFTLVGASAYINEDTIEYSVVVPFRSKVLSGKRSIEINIE